MPDKSKIALGSDWSPSGSKHVWDEFKFAYKYLTSYAASESKLDDEMLDMITVNPAGLLHADKVGAIKTGAFADFVIFNASQRDSHPSCILQNSDDGVIDMVMIGGNPVYFNEMFYEDFRSRKIIYYPEYQLIPESELKSGLRYVLCPSSLNIKLEEDLPALDKIFRDKGQKRSKLFSSCDKDYKDRILELEKAFLPD